MIELNEKQQNEFRTLIDIINLERKSLVFLNFTSDFLTSSDLAEMISHEYPDFAIFPKNVHTYVNNVFIKTKIQVLEENEFYRRKSSRNPTKQWKLTQEGKRFQPFVAFAMQFLPLVYDVSAFEVIGAMNTAAKKRASYARIDILMALAERSDLSFELSLRELSDLTGLSFEKTQHKLDDLAMITNVNGKSIPFVESVSGNKSIQNYVYLWTGKEFDKNDFRNRYSELISLLKIFSMSGKKQYFSSRDLVEHTKYSGQSVLINALSHLTKMGYINNYPSIDFRKYSITKDGLLYVRNCIDHSLGAILGYKGHIDHIMGNQPSKNEIEKCMRIYEIKKD